MPTRRPNRSRAAVALLTAAFAAGLLTGCSSAGEHGWHVFSPTDEPSSSDTGRAGADPTPVSEAALVAEAEAVAMPEDDFWVLIDDELRGSNADRAYRRLTEALASGPEDRLVPFEARLALVTYALDDETRVRWYDAHDPSGLGELEDDDFLYVRLDTVTAGRSTWQRALRDDTLPWGTTDAADRDGEMLLYVAQDAAHRHGISEDDWFDRAPFDDLMETGSNSAGWPDVPAAD